MISLTCTSCKAILEVDDAFAGGVCRCQHCGAIQTVPAHLKASSKKKTGKAAKTLYSKPSRDEAMPSSGLEQLAQVVSSSGLSPGLLAEAPGGHNSRMASSAKIHRIRLIAIGIVVVLGIIFFLLPGAKPAAPTNAAAPINSPAAPTPAAVKSPNFCGVPITAKSVTYVLDCGSGTGDLFSYLKEAAFQSVSTLGSGRQFQIVFWSNGSDQAFPSSGPTFATPANIESAHRLLDGVFAHGQSDAGPALKRAVAGSPELIILATGKSAQLDDAFVTQVLGIIGSSTVSVQTFDVGASEPSNAMRTIAQRTGGGAHALSEAELRQQVKD